MRKRIAIAIAIFANTIASDSAMAATEGDINKLTTYAVILGRAFGCGMDATQEMQSVGAWMDAIFPPGSRDQKIYLPIFMAGVQENAEKQANGDSPDNCGAVRRTYSKMPWP